MGSANDRYNSVCAMFISYLVRRPILLVDPQCFYGLGERSVAVILVLSVMLILSKEIRRPF